MQNVDRTRDTESEDEGDKNEGMNTADDKRRVRVLHSSNK